MRLLRAGRREEGIEVETGYPRIAAMNICHCFYGLDEFFSSAARAGYELAEIWTGPMHFFLDYAEHDSVEVIRGLAETNGIRIIGLCPEQNNPKPSNIAARGEAPRARTLSYFKNAIDVAACLGVPQVTCTSGWAFFDEPREAAWERSVSMLRTIAEYAEGAGVRLVAEALQHGESVLVNTAYDLRDLLDAVDRPALLACLDTGAMEAAGETISGYFEVLGANRIAHCHFVDTGEVSHVAWGDGHRDMRADLDELVANGYLGVCSIETYGERYFANPGSADAQVMDIYRTATEE